MRVQKGFTLIEVMIAVAVVAILSAIAIPSYTDYIRRARITDGRVIVLKAVKGADLLQVLNVDEQPNGIRLQAGNALTVIASREMGVWLVIGRG